LFKRRQAYFSRRKHELFVKKVAKPTLLCLDMYKN